MSERIDKGWYRNGAPVALTHLALSDSKVIHYCRWTEAASSIARAGGAVVVECKAPFYVTTDRNRKYCDDHTAAAKARTVALATAAAKARKAAAR